MPALVTFQQATVCADQSFSCFRAVNWSSTIDWVNDVDWYHELQLVVTATLMAAVIVSVIILVPQLQIWNRLPDWIKIPDWIQRIQIPTQSAERMKNLRRGPICAPRRSRYDSTLRMTMTDICICIYAWPSKGGVIIHDRVEAIDLEFLGLDPLNPPTKRLTNQDDEDDFCRRLLLLGAKWWDSEARFRFLEEADEVYSRAVEALEEETEPEPTVRERRWVSVAWPTTGGLWVAEFDTTLWGIIEVDNLLPSGSARLKLARTMDERSQILQDYFRPTFYADVKDYKGHAFLNSWDEKETGEVGPLMPLIPIAEVVQKSF